MVEVMGTHMGPFPCLWICWGPHSIWAGPMEQAVGSALATMPFASRVSKGDHILTEQMKGTLSHQERRQKVNDIIGKD